MEQKRRYLSAQDTMERRNIEKLTEKTSWYRKKIEKDDVKGHSSFEFEKMMEGEKERWKEKNSSWKEWRKSKRKPMKRKRMEDEDNIEKEQERKKLQAVLFLQHTPFSELAKNIREKLAELEKVGRIKLKIVERTGDKLSDILHKSDSWADEDCGRPDCIICSSVGENGKKGMCKKRNILYETYCETCETPVGNGDKGEKCDGEKGEIEGGKKRKREDSEERKKKKEKEEKGAKKDYKKKYIGESNRSGYERGLEHMEQFSRMDTRSHLLKHLVTKHPGKKPDEIKVGMRIVGQFRTAMERK